MTNSSTSTSANYTTAFAVGFSDTDGSINLVGSERPLPISRVRAEAAPAPLQGATSASTSIGPFAPLPDTPIHLQLSGTWAGSVEIRRTALGDATPYPITVGGMSWGRYTGNVNEVVWQEGERGAALYLAVTITSGTLNYRVSQ